MLFLPQVLRKEAVQTCRRRGVGGTCGACTCPRRVLVLACLARCARAAVGPRVPGVACAVSAGVACCIHVHTDDAHTYIHTCRHALVRISLFMYMYVHVSVYVCPCTCLCACVFTCLCVNHMDVRADARILSLSLTHTHTHKHM